MNATSAVPTNQSPVCFRYFYSHRTTVIDPPSVRTNRTQNKAGGVIIEGPVSLAPYVGAR